MSAYVPTLYADETTPPPRNSPNDWLIAKADGFFLDKNDLDYADLDEEPHELEHGAAIDFMRLETFPNSTLTINEDKTWTIDPPAPAAEAVAIWGEPESMSDSVEALIENSDLDADEYELIFYTWHDEVWTLDAPTGKFVRSGA